MKLETTFKGMNGDAFKFWNLMDGLLNTGGAFADAYREKRKRKNMKRIDFMRNVNREYIHAINHHMKRLSESDDIVFSIERNRYDALDTIRLHLHMDVYSDVYTSAKRYRKELELQGARAIRCDKVAGEMKALDDFIGLVDKNKALKGGE